MTDEAAIGNLFKFFESCTLHFGEVDYKTENYKVIHGSVEYDNAEYKVKIQRKPVSESVEEAKKYLWDHFEMIFTVLCKNIL